MQPRVTAILVARGASRLERTLTSLRSQSRPPEALVVVDTGLDADAAELASAASPTRFVPARGASVAEAVPLALRAVGPTESADEWLWLLDDGTPPAADALERLLAAVEVAPSVAIAGPKLVDPDDPMRIRSFGESISRGGATVHLVDDELDQAQHDRRTDVLAVAREGMLVRRAVFEQLGGFDPGLPHVDAGLDLGVRARLAGHRVIRVPRARVARDRRPEDVGRRAPASPRTRARLARRAQLHRRLVWAPAAAVPFHWLSLVPLAVARSLWRLLAKRPETIPGELAAAIAAAFDATVPAARRRLRRARRSGWGAVTALRVPPDELRERRAAARERRAEERGAELEIARAGFVADGGLAIVVIAALVGVGLQWRVLGADGLLGGALLPLADSVPRLWADALGSPGSPGDTVLGWLPADPFAILVAVLGTLFSWQPSLALVALWLAAVPLSALGAWWAATRLSPRVAPPLVAATLWMLAPPLLAGLAEGRPGAVLAHVLLPWLVFAGIEASRSWSAAAGAALLFAGVVAAAPVLTPALVVAAVVAAAVRPRAIVRTLGIPVLGLALLAPVAVVQFARGTPLGVLADPGAPTAVATPSGWQLLLGAPSATAGDAWGVVLDALGLHGLGALGSDGVPALLVPAILAVPLAFVALAAAFLPRALAAVASLALAALGLATALAATRLVVASDGADAVTPWPGSGLSLALLGVVLASVVGLDALARAGLPRLAGIGAATIAIAAAVAVAPAAALLAAGPIGDAPPAAVRAGDRVLPALVEAEAADDPRLGTLVLVGQSDGSLAVRVERGGGPTLGATSTLESTRALGDPTADDLALAELAGGLTAVDGTDPAPALAEFGIRFLLVPPAEPGGEAIAQRVTEALDASAAVTPVGETSAGPLWRSAASPDAGHDAGSGAAADRLGALPTAILGSLAALLLVTLLLAIPTGPRRHVLTPERAAARRREDPADTFDEDDHG